MNRDLRSGFTSFHSNIFVFIYVKSRPIDRNSRIMME